MPWQPLLEGPLKDRAWECVRAILDGLAPLARDPAGHPSLAGETSAPEGRLSFPGIRTG